MKRKILFTLIFSVFTIHQALAQQPEVISTSPADGAVDVNQDSVEIIFSSPILLDEQNPESTGFELFIAPEDSVTFTSFKLRDNGTRVVVGVELTDNTDFLGIVASALGVNGQPLAKPHPIQFTTSATAGPFSVQGTLTDDQMEKLKSNQSGFEDVLVFLSTETFTFQIEDPDPQDSGEEDDANPLYAAFADANTGNYVITGVREGTYFPFATNVVAEEPVGDVIPDFFLYDPDENFVPDNIEVNSATAVNDTLSNIDLRFLSFQPFGFAEAVERADFVAVTLENNPQLTGANTFYFFGGDMQFKNSLHLPLKTAQSEDPFDFSNPNGLNIFWEVFYYDSVRDSLAKVITTPFGSIFEEFVGAEDLQIPVELSSLKPIPDTFISSDSAAAIAEENGGQAFRNDNDFDFWQAELLAAHNYWELESDPTPDTPVMWSMRYIGFKIDQQTGETIEENFQVFIDMQTGEVLDEGTSVSNEDNTELPASVALEQNFPNPFNPSTNIPFRLNRAQKVEIAVFNILGQKVATVANQVFNAGSHTIQWDASSLSSGMYIYQLSTENQTLNRKLTLIK